MMPPEHRRAGCLSFWYFPGLSGFFVCAATCYELLDQLGLMALQSTEPCRPLNSCAVSLSCSPRRS